MAVDSSISFFKSIKVNDLLYYKFQQLNYEHYEEVFIQSVPYVTVNQAFVCTG